MIINDMLEKSIDQTIEGAVRTSQDDPAILERECSEYVLTGEAADCIMQFVDERERSCIDGARGTGLWISGTSGSGKTHFLKVLGRLLSGEGFSGTSAVPWPREGIVSSSFSDCSEEGFVGNVPGACTEDDVGGPFRALAERMASITSEVVVFNVDGAAGVYDDGWSPDTSLINAFLRALYQHQGFLGEDIGVARLEAYVDMQGKTAEFRAAFERVCGVQWLEHRMMSEFLEDDVVRALCEVLRWEEVDARLLVEKCKGGVSLGELVETVTAYVARQIERKGASYRLVFAADEAGRVVGRNPKRLPALLDIVEALEAVCAGCVSIVAVGEKGMDRMLASCTCDEAVRLKRCFGLHLALDSGDVGTIVKRRLLKKTPEGKALLVDEYAHRTPALEGYLAQGCFGEEASREEMLHDFVESYPFAPSQIALARQLLANASAEGSGNVFCSPTARNLLLGFQSMLQDIGFDGFPAVVPLWRLYDVFMSFAPDDVRCVIEHATITAELARGLEPCDVEVLKALCLMRVASDAPMPVSSLVASLVENLDEDRNEREKRVGESLARLCDQHYITRSGDAYRFLSAGEAAWEIASDRM